MLCPCGSKQDYQICCEPFHLNKENPKSAEQLMRARYSAYVVKAYNYLQQTLDPQTMEDFDPQGTREWGDSVQFTGLEILSAEENKNKALVEFKANFIKDGVTHVHHEKSKFRQQAGVWYFREGKIMTQPVS